MATPSGSRDRAGEAAYRKPYAAVDGVARVLAVIAAATIVLMMVATVADVARRYLLGRPIPGVIESGELLMVLSVFLGLAYTQLHGNHVAVTLVIDRLPFRAAAVCRTIGLLVVLGILVWMTVVTGQRALVSYTTNEFRFGVVQIPIWPGRIAIAIGLLAFALQLVPAIIENVRIVLGREGRLERAILGRSAADAKE